jgi:hypothetical protein
MDATMRAVSPQAPFSELAVGGTESTPNPANKQLNKSQRRRGVFLGGCTKYARDLDGDGDTQGKHQLHQVFHESQTNNRRIEVESNGRTKIPMHGYDDSCWVDVAHAQ